ncbi:MAG: hypothetical protein V2A61_05275 [Calditrichota bacterium]
MTLGGRVLTRPKGGLKSLSDNSQNDLRRTSPCHSREGGNDSDRHILHEI